MIVNNDIGNLFQVFCWAGRAGLLQSYMIVLNDNIFN